MLCQIRVQGIEAYCSDLIVDGETNRHVYLLGVAGHRSAVKGILANMLKGESLSVDVRGKTHQIERVSTDYPMKFKKMPSGYCHGFVLTRMDTDQEDEGNPCREFLLIARDPLEVKESFYDHLDRKTDVPLHPTWTDWLWSLFGARGWIRRLETLVGRYEVRLVTFHQGELREEISAAIRKKVPEVISCMKGR